MDELIKTVSEKTGLPEAQARKAAEAVIDFLKEKLPAPLAGQIDAVIGNEATTKSAMDILGKGMSLFGKK